MESEEPDDATSDPHFRTPRRDFPIGLEHLIWQITDEQRRDAERFLNSTDYLARQRISAAENAIRNCNYEDIERLFNRNLFRVIRLLSYYHSSFRYYNYWRRRVPEGNSEQIVPDIEVTTCILLQSSSDHVVPDGINQNSIPTAATRTSNNAVINSTRMAQEQITRTQNINAMNSVHTNRTLNSNISSNTFSSMRGITRDTADESNMRENSHNQYETTRQETYSVLPSEVNNQGRENFQRISHDRFGCDTFIDETNVYLHLYVASQETATNGTKKNNLEAQNSQGLEKTGFKLERCHNIKNLQNSTSYRKLSNGTCSPALELNVSERDERENNYGYFHEDKLPSPSTTMKSENIKRSESFKEQNTSNSYPVSSAVASASTSIASVPTNCIARKKQEINPSVQPQFIKLAILSNQNVSIDQNNFRTRISQSSNVPTSLCCDTVSLLQNRQNGKSSACFKNTDNENTVMRENTTDVPIVSFQNLPHMDKKKLYIAPNIQNEKEFSLSLHYHQNNSPSNQSNSVASLHSRPLEPAKQWPAIYRENLCLTTFMPKGRLMSKVNSENHTVKHMKEINERWKKMRDKIMHEKSLKLSEKVSVEKKGYSLNSKDIGMQFPGATAVNNETKLQSTFSDSNSHILSAVNHSIPCFELNKNSFVNSSITQRRIGRDISNKRKLLPSRKKECSENSSNSRKKIYKEIVQEKMSITSKPDYLTLSENCTNDGETNYPNVTSEIYRPIIHQGENAKIIARNSCTLDGGALNNHLQPFIKDKKFNSKELLFLNSGNIPKMKTDNKDSRYLSKNIQKDNGVNSLNHLSPSFVDTEMQNTDSALMDNCNDYKYVGVSETSKLSIEASSVPLSYMNPSKHGTFSKSKFEDAKRENEIVETNQNVRIQNSPLANYSSKSSNSEKKASNNKSTSSETSVEKSERAETYDEKVNNATGANLSFDKNKTDVNHIGDNENPYK